MNLGTFSVGTSDEGLIVVSNSCDGNTVSTGMTPAIARVYAAMMMGLADLLDPPTSEQREEPA